MSKQCQVTGKKPMFGHNVSHANNKTKRRFDPNIQKHRFRVTSLGRTITLRITSHGLRIIDKIGIDAYIQKFTQLIKGSRNGKK